jgi:lysophospholipase L1-like esterase
MTSLPSIYLIGDSISIQYHPFLEPLLAEHCAYRRKGGLELARANLDAVQGANGGDSTCVLEHLREELQNGLAESVVAINCGLHDIKRSPETGTIQVPPEDYRANLEEIIRLLHNAGKQLLWINTTPLDEVRHLRCNSSFHRREADLAHYNQIAFDVMQAARVPSIDLHTFTQHLPGELYKDHVHFLPEISRAQAGFLRREFDRVLCRQLPALHSFLGDSISDASRDKSDPASLGNGYLHMLAERLPAFRFRNLGISGNRLSDLRARLDEVPLESSSLTLYGGINDVVHLFKRNRPQSLEEFEADANDLLHEALRLGIPLRMMTPFLCEAKAVDGAEDWWPLPGERYARWRQALEPRITILRRLCHSHAIPCLELDPLLAPCPDVSIDGVHPNEKGHRLIAECIGQHLSF